jgi:hypothetical protein
VDRLIEGGIVKASEVGKVVVERQEEEAAPTPATNAPQDQRQAQQQGR